MDIFLTTTNAKALKRRKPPRLLIRNGYFVGIFKFVNDRYILTKRVNNETYGFRNEFILDRNCKHYKLNEWIGCNEAVWIPFEYDLRIKKHIEVLNSCLGGSEYAVTERMIIRIPKRL